MQKILEYMQTVSQAVLTADYNEVQIQKMVGVLLEARARGSTVYLVGNGGSASTASHFANDLIKIGNIHAISLPDLTPTILAYGNDFGWNLMFSEYLAKRMKKNDVLIAISCSGRSMNILKAAEETQKLGGKLLILTGRERNNPLVEMKNYAHVCIDHVNIRVQEDVHLVICHAIAGAL